MVKNAGSLSIESEEMGPIRPRRNSIAGTKVTKPLSRLNRYNEHVKKYRGKLTLSNDLPSIEEEGSSKANPTYRERNFVSDSRLRNMDHKLLSNVYIKKYKSGSDLEPICYNVKHRMNQSLDLSPFAAKIKDFINIPKRKRSKSVVSFCKTIANFGHDKRSNLQQKVLEMQGQKKNDSIVIKKIDDDFQDDSSASSVSVSDLQNKIQELEQKVRRKEESRKQFEGIVR